MASAPKLYSSAEWTNWESFMIYIAVDEDIWDNVNPDIRVPWLQKPLGDSTKVTWYLYERQQNGMKALRHWIMDNVSDTLASTLRDLRTADPNVWYDTLVRYLNVTPSRLPSRIRNTRSAYDHYSYLDE